MNKIILTLALSLLVHGAVAKNRKSELAEEISQATHAQGDRAPNGPLIEVAFSPDAGSETLILKIINASQRSIRLAAYSFTSPSIVRALVNAKKRGVNVNVVVDHKGNRSKKSIAALNLLVNAGIPTRTISAYTIHHDKYIVSDDRHVETGSFNYSQAAVKSNSENVIVIWHNPAIAATYLNHWKNRFEQGIDFRSTY